MNTTMEDVSIYDEIALNARIDVEPIRVDAESRVEPRAGVDVRDCAMHSAVAPTCR